MTRARADVSRQIYSSRRGLTLVETLVVLAVVAALFAITIPVLRGVLAQSQTTKNLSNMSQTMKDFFTWSGMNNGRMVNMGIPPAENPFGYRTQDRGWPDVLYEAFGEASPHWQSTYSDPSPWLNGTMSLAEARGRDPEWEWRVPSDYIYSETMFTAPNAWRHPGLQLPDLFAYSEHFAYILVADISSPANKGVLWHDHIEPGPGRQRQIAFADGAVSQRDILAARPSAAHPMSQDAQKRFGPVAATLKGALGQDY